jgi:hypothetical protein
LAQLKAVIHRCPLILDELHLLGAFAMKMRFAQLFSQLTHPCGRLAHLHITAQLDPWQLQAIQKYLARQLISLAVVPIPEELDTFRIRKNHFQQLLAKCNKVR